MIMQCNLSIFVGFIWIGTAANDSVARISDCGALYLCNNTSTTGTCPAETALINAVQPESSW